MVKISGSKQLIILLSVVQVSFLVLFGVFVRYDENALDEDTTRTYSFFQDAHMMVIGGIGFLISYMKCYRYSGPGI